jgi:hypothetical protein
MAVNDFSKLAKRLTQSAIIVSTVERILSIKSGKKSGKVDERNSSTKKNWSYNFIKGGN